MDTVTVQLPMELYNALKKYAYIFTQQFPITGGTGEMNFTSSPVIGNQKREIPTLNDVVDEVKRIGSAVNAQRFFNYYTARDWRNKDGSTFEWKAKLKEWGTYNLEKSNREEEKKQSSVYHPTAADVFIFQKQEANG